MSPPDRRCGHVSRQLRQREQSHRRVVLVGIASLIALSTSPIFGHHLETQGQMLLAGRDQIGPICLTALHVLLAPVHGAFHLALVAGLVYALWDRWRAWLRLRRTLRAVDASAPGVRDPLSIVARRVGLAAEQLRVVPGLPNPAFTVGLWRPRVYVAADLSDVLDEPQLEAVLAHEAFHVARRDPLRVWLMRMLACTLFYIPALRRLADDLADEAEIDADDAAASQGNPLVLASAILRLAEWRAPETAGALTEAAFAGAATGFVGSRPGRRIDLLERRIRRLAGEHARIDTHVTRRSLAAAAATLVAVWVSGVVMAHPLPEQRFSEPGGERESLRCEQSFALALGHLRRVGAARHADGSLCRGGTSALEHHRRLPVRSLG